MTCTFFGHRDTPQNIEPILHSVLIDFIENKQVNIFYVGNHGCFDHMVTHQLQLLKADYPFIYYAVILSYMPREKTKLYHLDHVDTIYPHVLNHTPPKYAIIQRNKWMISKSDFVITYVKYPFGGASQFKKIAENSGKIVVNLADLFPSCP